MLKYVSEETKKAGNRSFSILERFSFARKADSAALQIHNIERQFICEKMIATLYLTMDSLETAKMYFRNMAMLAKDIPDSLGVALNDLGTVSHRQTEYDSALLFYQSSSDIFRKNNDRHRLAQSLVNIGIEYKNHDEYEKAFNVTLEGANILETMNDQDGLSSVYTTLGNILKELRRYDEAMNYLNLALEIRNKTKDSAAIASSLNNIGNIYKANREYSKALAFYRRSLELKQTLGLHKAAATTLDNIAEVYFELKQYKFAEQYFVDAFDLRKAEHVQDDEGLINTSNNLAALYLAENKIGKAQTAAIEAYKLIARAGLPEQRLENRLLMSSIYRKLNQYESALHYDDSALIMKDSLVNTNMSDTIARLNVKYETRQKEKELAMSRKLQAAQANQIHFQIYFIILLIGVSLLLCIVAIMFYRSAKFRKQAKQKVDTLMAELNHRVTNNLQVISGMLNLQMDSTPGDKHIEVIRAIKNRVESISLLHHLLYHDKYDGTVSIKDFLGQLTTNLNNTYHEKSRLFDNRLDICELTLNTKQAIPLGLIVNELVTNIYKYAKTPDKTAILEICFRFMEDRNNCILTISDNCGYWDINEVKGKNKGFGLILVDTLVKQLRGKHKVAVNYTGTTHVIEFYKSE